MSDAERSLQEGAPLAVVLASVPQIPGRVLALVAAAERAGRLPQVLSRLMKQRRAASVRRWDSIPFYRVYPLILGLVVIGVGAMLVICVAPKFEQIFKDFRTPLPEVTRLSLQFARDSGPWIALLAMLMLCWLILSTVASRWRGSAFGLVEDPLDWLVNRLPWIGKVRAYRALGDVLEFASDGVAEGRPLDATLLEASQITANSHVREQIENWVTQMSRGRTLADAARDAGLPRLVSSMLATAQQTPDVAEVFRFLGRYYSTRFSRAAAILQAAVIPVVVILMGCVVAWMELSVLLPLMRLVDRMSPYPTGL
jgi:type II secretory pathway component PulF